MKGGDFISNWEEGAKGQQKKEGPGLCLRRITLAVGSGKETSQSRTEGETGSEPAAVTWGSVLVRASIQCWS